MWVVRINIVSVEPGLKNREICATVITPFVLRHKGSGTALVAKTGDVLRFLWTVLFNKHLRRGMSKSGLLRSMLSATVGLIGALSPGVRLPWRLLLLLRRWKLLWVMRVVVVIEADGGNQRDLS